MGKGLVRNCFLKKGRAVSPLNKKMRCVFAPNNFKKFVRQTESKKENFYGFAVKKWKEVRSAALPTAY